MSKKIKGITIEIGGNTINLQKSIDQSEKASASLNSELREINKQLRFDPSSTILLSQKQDVLKGSIEAAKDKLKELETVQQDIERAYKKGDIDDGQYRAYQREVEQTKDKLKLYESQLGHTKEKQEIFNKKIDEAREHLNRAKDTFNENARKAKQWSLAVGGAITAAGGVAAKYAMDFETAFAKTSTLLDGDKVNLDNYKDDILKISNELGVSASETSEAVYQALSASVDQDKALAFTRDAFKLAKGGFTELPTAVDVLTTALNAYGISADKAEKVSDILVQTQNLGKTTVAELADKMGNVIPTAAAYNVSLESIGTAYAMLTKRGVNTASATTQIRQLLIALAKEGEAANILHDQTGKSFQELSKEGKSLGDVLGIIYNALGGDIKQVDKLFKNVKAKSAAVSILKNGTAEFNTTLKKMANSSGTAEKAYSKMSDTTAHKIEVLKTNIQNSAITIGEGLLPVVQDILEEAEDHLPEIQKFIKNTSKGLGDILKWAWNNRSTVKFYAKEILAIIAAVKAYKAAKWIAETSSATRTLITATTTATAATEAQTVAQTGLNAAMSANVIGAVVSGLVMLGTTIWNFCSAADEADAEMGKLNASQSELVDQIKDSYDEYQRVTEERQKAMSAIDSEYDHYDKLWGELDSIVDKNGEIKEGYQNRAEFIMGELSEAFDIEFEKNGNIIQNYKDIKDEIDEVIKKKKLLAQQEAFEGEYKTAKAGLQENQAQFLAAKREKESLEDELKRQRQLKAYYNRLIKENDGIDAAIPGRPFDSASVEIGKINDKINKVLKPRIRELRTSYNEAQDIYYDSLAMINNYEKFSEALISGNEETINKYLTDLQYGFISSKNGTEEVLSQQVADAKKAYNDLTQALKEGVAGVTSEQVKSVEKYLQKTEKALKNYQKQHEEAGYLMGSSYVEGYIKGLGSAGSAENSGFGADNQRREKFAQNARNIPALAAKYVAEAQDSHSPSRVAEKYGGYWPEGYVIGFAEKAKAAREKLKEAAQAMNSNIERAAVPRNISYRVNSIAAAQAGKSFSTSSSKVYNNAPVINLNLNGVSVRSEADIDTFARKVSQFIASEIELKGVSNGD